MVGKVTVTSSQIIIDVTAQASNFKIGDTVTISGSVELIITE